MLACNGFSTVIFKQIEDLDTFLFLISKIANIDRSKPYKQQLFGVINFVRV